MHHNITAYRDIHFRPRPFPPTLMYAPSDLDVIAGVGVVSPRTDLRHHDGNRFRGVSSGPALIERPAYSDQHGFFLCGHFAHPRLHLQYPTSDDGTAPLRRIKMTCHKK